MVDVSGGCGQPHTRLASRGMSCAPLPFLIAHSYALPTRLSATRCLSFSPGAKFELYICSPKFDGMKLLDRHRLINGLLTDSGLMARIHAVTLKCWTPQQWNDNAAQLPQQS